jgi:tRNA A-37 threonylcarbamoyl transferase component Bud32
MRFSLGRPHYDRLFVAQFVVGRNLGSLPWGTHTLEVQGRLGSGPWSTIVRHSLTVMKPIWLTWPVLLGFTGIGVVAGSLGTVRYKKRVEREKKALPDLAEWRLASLVPEGSEIAGTNLDARFYVDRVLARGGFATVFSGVDLWEERPCAIKIFRRELAGQVWLDKQFRQEVAALESIHHPNVVQVYGHGSTHSGSMYLAMEFIDGRTLRETLASGPLSHYKTAALLQQAGGALDRLHSQGIYHRDLKPENIMLRQDCEPGSELVLVDFSIAIIKNADESIYGLSRAAGTLHYMAPEQVLGYADESSDIYSLAKIVLEMLTGRPLSELLPRASLDLPQRIPNLLERSAISLSPPSVTILCSALEFDPAKRPRHASEFANQIASDLSVS